MQCRSRPKPRRRWLLIAIGLCAVLPGNWSCGRKESPLPRLEKESPVQSSPVELIDLTINGRGPGTAEDPVVVAPGEFIDIEGQADSSKWRLGSHWTRRDGEPRRKCIAQGVTKDSPPALLFAFLYEEPPEENAGIVQEELVDTCLAHKDDPTFELRVRLSAPERSGAYVIDIQFVDQYYPGGEDPSKPAGFPIWRSVIDVR